MIVCACVRCASVYPRNPVDPVTLVSLHLGTGYVRCWAAVTPRCGNGVCDKVVRKRWQNHSLQHAGPRFIGEVVAPTRGGGVTRGARHGDESRRRLSA